MPLTLEDVLHPLTGDFIVQTDAHDTDVAYLKAVSRSRLADEPAMVVLSDCRVDFNIPGVKPLGPDVAVFSGLRRFITWATFDVAEERAKPEMVVEVTSPSTRKNDVVIKRTLYHRARVPWYVIADVTLEEDDERRIELSLLRWTRTGYKKVQPDEQGRVWLEPIRLWLGQVRDPRGGYMRLACFDPETGAEVGDYTAISQALDEALRLREEAEAARAEAESARTEAERLLRERDAALAEALERLRRLEAAQGPP